MDPVSLDARESFKSLNSVERAAIVLLSSETVPTNLLSMSLSIRTSGSLPPAGAAVTLGQRNVTHLSLHFKISQMRMGDKPEQASVP